MKLYQVLPQTATQIAHLNFSQAKELLYRNAYTTEGLKLQLSTILFGIDEGSEEKEDNLNVLDASMKLYLSLQESSHVNMIYKKAILSS